jgi:hypothetical protein
MPDKMSIEDILYELLQEVVLTRQLLEKMNESNDLHFEEWRKKNG